MKIIENIFNETIWTSNIFQRYFDNLNYIFLDIETTGIFSEQNKVILIGILEKYESSFVIKQYFAENKEEEKEILEHIIENLSKADVIINYNATSFDIPFLNKRFQKNNIPYNIPNYSSFDLYKIIKNHGCIPLSDYKLKTVEKYMGIERTDTISGQESICLYNEYQNNKDLSLREKILKHNLEDIYNLTKILPIINKLDLHEVMFKNSRYIKELYQTCQIIIKKNKLKKNYLLVEGICLGKSKDYTAYSPGYQIHFFHEKSEFLLKIPLHEENNIQHILLSDIDIHYKKQISLPHISDEILVVKDGTSVSYMEINSFLDMLLPHLVKKI